MTGDNSCSCNNRRHLHFTTDVVHKTFIYISREQIVTKSRLLRQHDRWLSGVFCIQVSLLGANGERQQWDHMKPRHSTWHQVISTCSRRDRKTVNCDSWPLQAHCLLFPSVWHKGQSSVLSFSHHHRHLNWTFEPDHDHVIHIYIIVFVYMVHVSASRSPILLFLAV